MIRREGSGAALYGGANRLRIELRPYRLPLRAPWVSAAGVVEERRGWLLALYDSRGHIGYGECAPLPQAGTESHDEAGAWLSRWRDAADGAHRSHLETALTTTTAPPAARCAIECALLDLRASATGRPMARCLDIAAPDRVKVNAAVGGLDDGVVERMEAAWLEGYRVFKVKVGLNPVEEERRRLRHLADRLPGGLLRLDANGAWKPEEALTMVDAMNELPVESLEEPIREHDLAFLALLQRRARFPLALDESLARVDLEALFRWRHVRRLVLKPTVLGGVTPTMELARRARAAGMSVVITTTLEGAAGGWLAAHLAAAAGDGTAAHGLATGVWFAEDIGTPPAVVAGAIDLGGARGLGFRPENGLC